MTSEHASLSARVDSRHEANAPKLLEKVGYGLGGAANNVIWTGISTFLVYFYTDVVGVAAGLIGTVMLVSRVLDGISDVLMGLMLDKTRSRHGKARPWLLWLAVPFAVAAVLLFTVPDLGPVATIGYVVLTYNLALLIYTAVEIPHGTLGALMTYDQHQRSVLNVAKMIGAYVAIIVISNVTMPLTEYFGGGRSGWIQTFVVYGALAAAIYLINFRTTTERTDPGGVNRTRPPVKASLWSLLRNRYWLIATLVLLLMYIFNAMTSGMAIYYAENILGSPALVGVVTTALTLATLVGMFVVVPIARRFGKRDTALFGCVVAVFGSLLILAGPAEPGIVVLGQVIRGVGKAAVMGVIFAMLADTMEYGEWKTGIRIEGLIYSGASMGIKIGTGLGSGLVGWGLALSGYVGTRDVQTAEATAMISGLFIWVPTLVSIVMAGLLLAFKLDRQYPEILAQLRERDQRTA